MAKPNRLESMVDRVIKEADILLLIVDARRINESINRELESKIKYLGKKLIYVINKCDLITKEEQDKINVPDSIQVSAKKHWGTIRLLKYIMKLAKGDNAKVGVLGYPNTGKSSIINALKGSKSAPTSPISGYTRSLQNIRVNRKIMMIDTPGLIPYSQRQNASNIVIGAIDSTRLRDPEGAAMNLIKELDGKIEKFYEVEKKEDTSETLEEIALKRNVLKKGGLPDTRRMAINILDAWQRGKIK